MGNTSRHFLSILLAAVLVTGCQTVPEGPLGYDTAMRMGDEAIRDGNPGLAVLMYGRAVSLMPGAIAPLSSLGDALELAGNAEEALRVYSRILDKDPTHAQALRGAGMAHLAMLRPLPAQEHFLRALRVDDGDHRSLIGLGIAEDMQSRHVQAQDAYRRALVLAPGSRVARNNLALSLALSGAFEDARSELAMLEASGSAGSQRDVLTKALILGLEGDDAGAREISMRVLDPAAVENNLRQYALLRAMDPRERVRVIMGHSLSVETRSPASPGT